MLGPRYLALNLQSDYYIQPIHGFFNLAQCQGLKTGMYYLRTRAAADAIKFTVDTALLKENQVHVLPLEFFHNLFPNTY
jgi:hypothetical protein